MQNETKCSCGAEATTSIAHPDAGIDFGRMGVIRCCEPCYIKIEQELIEEVYGDDE